jgi:hypothetical protein
LGLALAFALEREGLVALRDEGFAALDRLGFAVRFAALELGAFALEDVGGGGDPAAGKALRSAATSSLPAPQRRSH